MTTLRLEIKRIDNNSKVGNITNIYDNSKTEDRKEINDNFHVGSKMGYQL